MTSPYYQYGLELSNGRPQFYVGTGVGLAGAGMDSALALNQWSHLAVVFNGSQAQFYVNGALVSSKALNVNLTARGGQMRLGADADTQQFYKGVLDNVRIYNRALTQAEVQSDMSRPVCRASPPLRRKSGGPAPSVLRQHPCVSQRRRTV